MLNILPLGKDISGISKKRHVIFSLICGYPTFQLQILVLKLRLEVEVNSPVVLEDLFGRDSSSLL